MGDAIWSLFLAKYVYYQQYFIEDLSKRSPIITHRNQLGKPPFNEQSCQLWFQRCVLLLWYINSNSSHVGWLSELSDTILKVDILSKDDSGQLWLILVQCPSKVRWYWSEKSILVKLINYSIYIYIYYMLFNYQTGYIMWHTTVWCCI
jgi:hypothetical protein